MITYPTNRLLAVFDHPSQADAAVQELLAEGFPQHDIERISGLQGRAQLRRLGPARGPLAGFVRMFQFITMDQMPDFPAYESAIGEGRTVIAVRVRQRDRVVAARRAAQASGGHFINYYGRFATEEMTRWRGGAPGSPRTA
jgi:hypothetical protein